MLDERTGTQDRRRGGLPAAGEDLELNMTPMIDIVFQLIVFFLLSLKFKTVDERIDSMLPKDRGQDPKPVVVPDEPKVKVKLFRRNVGDDRAAYTLVKVDNAAQFTLPAGWRGRERESADRVRAYDRTIQAVRDLLERRVGAAGAAGLKGEIVAPPPTGGFVPHADAIALLDAFLQVGITDVMIEGQAAPLTKREREARRTR